ncbi:uncharacterized protein CC84DRAFT_1200770 [Paraphaeosphaeria sporulosa]|uniref:Uncharacterized protein n=1 Tax=Paraphaeosphaeria sporulosa TaxID=1460663 RepID=A0A177CWT9_9PLEO|nr:uncharacterized protein CC84DRAFT_1200770 [Paraphaeosphaeria sporulosa]OAG11508.1 hypothetical protein CC84DRAFT_1200770 [Paraphaeosphaeria sporulosa]
MTDTPPLPEATSELQQHPVPPLPSTPLSPPPGLLLSHPPPVRLSSSPASSPRIVGSPPTRTQSIHPETGSLMAAGTQPGADFLELTSDDDSEWEDDDGTRRFSDVERMGSRVSAATFESTRSEDWERERGRKRQSEHLTALPPVNQISAHDSATEEVPPAARRPPSQARQMSLKRYSRVNVVHNHGSPRSSILSNDSSDVIPRPLNVSRTVSQNLEEDPPSRVSTETHRRYQRSTSESESIRMNAFLNAHYATLQAIDSQPNSPPAPQFSFPDTSRQRSFSAQRHIKLMPSIHTDVHDPDRPPHLPAHFIKTPYPFSPKKEFPPPKTRPRKTDLYITPLSTSPQKGIHVLGMAHDTAYDPRSRLERNISAQGLIHSPSSPTTKHERWNSARSTNSARESYIWLSLRRNRNHIASRMESLTIPSSLVATPQPSPTFKPKLRHLAADYDDMHFARELRATYRRLAGPWVLRVLSARKLRYIRLAQVSAWSGSSIPPGLHEQAGTLLAARSGLPTLGDPGPPFTEHALLDLYRAPRSGDARYTWVHWARRVAASNRRPSDPHAHERTRSDGVAEREVTTVQFVHAFAPFKMLTVLVVMLAVAVAAAVLYIFLGNSVWRGEGTRERAEKVTPGMLVGMLALGVEGVVFVAWVVGSWMWL